MSLVKLISGDGEIGPAAIPAVLWGLLTVLSAVVLTLCALQAFALRRIAKNRGCPRAWLAFIPFGFRYLLGRLSDDMNAAQRKRTFYRLSAPLLQAAFWAMIVTLQFLQRPVRVMEGGREVVWFVSELPLFVWIASGLGLAALLAQTAVKCLAMYRIFWEYEPARANVRLILSVLLPVTVPFFLMGLMNKAPYEELLRQEEEKRREELAREEVTPETIALERLNKHARPSKEKEPPAYELPQELFVVKARPDGRDPFAPPEPQAQ